MRGGKRLHISLPRSKQARAELYVEWAQAALRSIIGDSTLWNVRVLMDGPCKEIKQWRLRVEGPDGAWVRDIDTQSSESDIVEVVASAHDEITRSGAPFARL